MPFPTAFGDVPIKTLVETYEAKKRAELKSKERKRSYLQTEEGKAKNRARAKAYYEKNKEAVRARVLSKYVHKRPRKTQPEDPPAAPPAQETPAAEV